ncbi:MAG: hypothetical protein DI539_19390 [Flavobacterium psychrophilum]|nr:MAG: hypothetical protein DI539_19390 [Flavobacterium psychrophilum]
MVISSIVSCQKELSEENGGNPSEVNGTLKMKVDGVQWIADKIATASIENGTLTITGLDNGGKSLHIELADNGAANYSLNQQTVDYATVTDTKEANPVAYATDGGQNANDAGGEVIVTNIDQTNKTISGTFSFKVYRDADSKQLVITEGSFENLKYTGDEPSNPGGSVVTPTFSVKIDGAGFTPANLNIQRSSSMIVITATQTAGASAKVVMLTMPEAITAGTYDLQTSGSYIGSYAGGSATGGSIFLSISGKLTITEHDKTNKVIKGTFFFEGKDQIGSAPNAQLTEGAFTVQYQ